MAMMISQIGMMAKTIVRGFREQTVTEVLNSYRQPFPTTHLVLVDREYYRVSDFELAELKAGTLPEDLELDALPTDEDGELL